MVNTRVFKSRTGLWCTCETACVQQRGLLVAIAGEGLSAIQHRLRLLGSFTPALCAGGPAEQLLRLNLIFYLSQAALCFDLVVQTLAVCTESSKRALHFKDQDDPRSLLARVWLAVLVVLVLLVNPFVFFAVRRPRVERGTFTLPAPAA